MFGASVGGSSKQDTIAVGVRTMKFIALRFRAQGLVDRVAGDLKMKEEFLDLGGVLIVIGVGGPNILPTNAASQINLKTSCALPRLTCPQNGGSLKAK
jgi:hypothetical protein